MAGFARCLDLGRLCLIAGTENYKAVHDSYLNLTCVSGDQKSDPHLHSKITKLWAIFSAPGIHWHAFMTWFNILMTNSLSILSYDDYTSSVMTCLFKAFVTFHFFHLKPSILWIQGTKCFQLSSLHLACLLILLSVSFTFLIILLKKNLIIFSLRITPLVLHLWVPYLIYTSPNCFKLSFRDFRVLHLILCSVLIIESER